MTMPTPLKNQPERRLEIAIDPKGQQPILLVDATTGEPIHGVTAISIVSRVESMVVVQIEIMFEADMLLYNQLSG